MSFYPEEKLLVLLDGKSLYAAARNHGMRVNYEALHKHLFDSATLQRVRYYTTVDEIREHISFKPLLDWLAYNGHVVTTVAERESDGGRSGRCEIISNMIVDAMEVADRVDHVVLGSGNGELAPLVRALQRRGVKVTVMQVIGPDRSLSHPVADELRRQADQLIDMFSIPKVLGPSPEPK